MSGPARDRLRVVLVTPAERFEAMRTFYMEVVGLELEYHQPGPSLEAAGGLLGFIDGPLRLVVASPGALPAVPSTPTTGALLLIEVSDAAATRQALASRGVDDAGPLQEGGGATFFALPDPMGNQVWLISYGEQAEAAPSEP